MSSVVRITGIGLATPLGATAAATWAVLGTGRAIDDHARVPGLGADAERDAVPRVNRLARLVAREAVNQAGWNRDALQPAAVIVGTSKGPVDHWLQSLAKSPPAGGMPLELGLGDCASDPARELGIRGPRLTLSAACASGLLALGLARR